MVKIEEEIKQEKFSDNYEKAFINMLYTGSYLTRNINYVFKNNGITHHQFNVLKILKGRHPGVASAQEIKDVMIDKSPDLTRLIDRLIQKDLVIRRVCKENRRKIDVQITKTGLALIDQITPDLSEFMKTLRNISNDEAIELSRILDKLRA